MIEIIGNVIKKLGQPEFMTWKAISKIGRSKIMSLTILVPVIGYMILFNASLVSHFELSNELFNESNSSESPISSGNKSRLFYFYFGFFFLGLSTVLYKLVCPVIVKENSSAKSYVDEVSSTMTKLKIAKLVEVVWNKVGKNKGLRDNVRVIRFVLSPQENISELGNPSKLQNITKYDKGLSEQESHRLNELMVIYWDIENESKSGVRVLIAVLYAIGFVILTIPTIEMFLKVSIAFID